MRFELAGFGLYVRAHPGGTSCKRCAIWMKMDASKRKMDAMKVTRNARNRNGTNSRANRGQSLTGLPAGPPNNTK
jgi:hypothetical protein